MKKRLTEIQPVNNLTIGGSQITAVLGYDRYTTAYDLWKNLIYNEGGSDDNKYMRRGRYLEPAVLSIFSEECGYNVVDTQCRISAGAARGSIDAIVEKNGEKYIIEIKTTSAYITAENIPVNYELQLQWYLGLSNNYLWKIKFGIIVILDASLNVKVFEREYNEEMFNVLDEKVGEWYCKYIIDKNEPQMGVRNYEMLTDISDEYKIIEGVAGDDISFKLSKLDEIKNEIKTLEKEKEKIEDEIKMVIGEKKGIILDDRKITWLLQKRESVDSKLLKNKYPEIYEEVKKISEFRVLRY